MKFPIKDFFSKCKQICRKLRIRSYLQKKSLMESFPFCVVLKTTEAVWHLNRLRTWATEVFGHLNRLRTWVIKHLGHFGAWKREGHLDN